MATLSGPRATQLRKAARFSIQPGKGTEATLHYWVPDAKGGEAAERQLVIDHFLRGIEKLPSIVQIPHLDALPAWAGFAKNLKAGDLLQLEWTVDGGVARSAQTANEQWRARLVAQREGKQVSEFIIRATGVPQAAAPSRSPGGGQLGAARPPGAAGVKDPRREPSR